MFAAASATRRLKRGLAARDSGDTAAAREALEAALAEGTDSAAAAPIPPRSASSAAPVP